jgi:esterase/lipase superfamily enzyme
MLFVTNRTPRQSPRSRRNRRISFDLDNTAVSQYLYFCERQGVGDYLEIMHEAFFERLRDLSSRKTEVLLYIHGFNNTPEESIFPKAQRLQALLDEHAGVDAFHVVPLIWPCDDDSFVAIADDYWDDQAAADRSGGSFARMLGFFDGWRRCEAEAAASEGRPPCTRRINILSHSMGARVLRNALREWVEELGGGQMPMMFRNMFLMAPDVRNLTLEADQDGRYLPVAARNLVVYYAGDDLAMPASKVANLRSRTVSQRLGMTGPRNLDRVPENVYAVDCDDFNNSCDPPLGHGYHVDCADGRPSPALLHMIRVLTTGRVEPDVRRQRLSSGG